MCLVLRLLGLFLVISAIAAAQFQIPEGGGIVYGDEIGVVVSAPSGWVFDAESGVSQDLHAVMYPVGSSWANATEVMYVSIAKLDTGASLQDFIDGDIARFRERSPSLAVEASAPLELSGGKSAQVRYFSGDSWGNLESIAYATKGSSVAIYVLSCRTKEGFDRSLPAFNEVVSRSLLASMVFEE